MTDIAARSKTTWLQSRWLRTAVIVLAALQVVLFVVIETDFLMRSGSMDLITRGINQLFAQLIIIPLVLLTLPALVLAILRRWLGVALVLALLPVPGIIWLFANN